MQVSGDVGFKEFVEKNAVVSQAGEVPDDRPLLVPAISLQAYIL
jgi:hypothetical protein